MRCEGYRKKGSFMTLGPREWKQCEKEATVQIKFEEDGEVKSLPACNDCWKDCIDFKIKIIEVFPL